MYLSSLHGLGHVTCSGQWTVTRHSGNRDFKWVYVVHHRSCIPAICYKTSILFYLVLRINTHGTYMNLRHRLKPNPANLKTHKWQHKYSLWTTEFSGGLLCNIILPIDTQGSHKMMRSLESSKLHFSFEIESSRFKSQLCHLPAIYLEEVTIPFWVSGFF